MVPADLRSRIAPWPDGLFMALQKSLAHANRAPTRTPSPPLPAPDNQTTARARKALSEELAAVAAAGEGARNDTLNRAAFSLGQLNAAGELPDVKDDLVAAAMEAGLGHGEAVRTVASGWEAGTASPRQDKPRVPRGAPASPRRSVAGSGASAASAASSTAPTKGAILCTDLGNARRIVKAHGGDLRWTDAHGWLVWDGKRWAPDRLQEVQRRAKSALESIFDEAKEAGSEGEGKHAEELFKWALRSQASGRIDAALRLAESEPGVAVHPDTFDQDLWSLNLRNGTLDLRTGNVRPHRREDLLTKLAGVSHDPNAARPERWLRFLERSVPDPDVRQFLQRWVGYTLTGRTDEECFVFLYGNGRNGKSTFTETIAALMGEYSQAAPFDTFLPRQRAQATNDLARLAGARMVSASEPEEQARLSESVVKLLTGGDRVAARFLHKEFFEYLPQFKVFMLGNHRPRITGTDLGIWRRVRLLSWDVIIPEAERDPTLKGPNGVLQASELPGILRWAVEGCLAWQKGGLAVPQAVLAATAEYREAEDVVGQFLAERCEIGANRSVSALRLRGVYEAWCRENGEHPMSQKALGKRLTERGFTRERKMTGHFWRGLECLAGYSHDPSDPSDPSLGISAENANCTREKYCSKGQKGHMGHREEEEGCVEQQRNLELHQGREPGEDG